MRLKMPRDGTFSDDMQRILMIKEYTMDDLIKIFTEHSIEQELWRKEHIKQWEENNPNKELPKIFEEKFEIIHALMSIVKEIKEIKCHLNSASQ